MLLPLGGKQSAAPDHVYDAGAFEIKSVLDVINHVHKQHEGSLWILGASIVTPAGQKVLISGPLSSGKSTTVLALVFGCGWKVLSEDITHIDMATNEIVNFGSPFALKPGTMDLLSNTYQFETPGTNDTGSWMPLGSANLGHNLKTPFDLVVYFEEFSGGPFKCEEMSVPEFTRTILRKSNITRINDAPNKLYEYVSEGSCYRISDGSLKERVDAITRLCAIKQTNKNEDKSCDS